MDAYVFDVNPLITLNKEKILEEALIGIQSHDKYICDENFKEVWGHHLRSEIKKKINIFKSDEDEFNVFREKLKKNHIAHSRKDLFVLYVVEKIYDTVISSPGMVYAVTFDDGLISTIEKYIKKFNKSNLRVWTTVDLLNQAHIEKVIDYPTFVEKSLRLFKYHEIHKYIDSYKRLPNYYNNDVSKIGDLIKGRFQIYKKHLVENTNLYLKEKNQWMKKL